MESPLVVIQVRLQPFPQDDRVFFLIPWELGTNSPSCFWQFLAGTRRELSPQSCPDKKIQYSKFYF